MKDYLKVVAIQFAPKWLDRTHNAMRMAEWVEWEAHLGAELVVFPELANVGFITPVIIGQEPSFDENTSALDFQVKYKKAAESIPGPTTDLLCQVAKKWNVHVVIGIAQRHPIVPGTLYNAAVLLGPSGIVGVQHKVHIPNYERWFFYPGETPQVFDTPLGRIGMSVCYDGHYFPEVNRIQALRGVEIICQVANVPGLTSLPGGTPFQAFPMEDLAYTRALENACYYIHANRSGAEGASRFMGNSVIVGPDGTVVATTDSDQEISLSAELHNHELLYARSKHSIFRDRRPELYGEMVKPLSSPLSGNAG